MSPLIEKLGKVIERGKIDKNAPYPPDMQDQDGADEVTKAALEAGESPDEILKACNTAMERIGDKFGRNEVFVPELLMAAKAMNTVMEHLKPFFQSGNIQTKGTFILGTVAGDLHDIGKNLVRMVVEGNGWNVIDLGVDAKADKFLKAIDENPGCIVGLSALLTTTMGNMASTLKAIKEKFAETKVIVGGAPLTAETAKEMGADGYAGDPQDAVHFLDSCL